MITDVYCICEDSGVQYVNETPWGAAFLSGLALSRCVTKQRRPPNRPIMDGNGESYITLLYYTRL